MTDRELRPRYTWEAFKNPFNLGGIAVAAGLSVVTGGALPLILAAGAELIYLGTVPGMWRYRRLIDSRFHAQRRLAGRTADAEVYKGLSPNQQATFDALGEVRRRIKESYRRLGGGTQLLAGQSLDKIDSLLSSFLRLLDQLNAYRRYLSATDRTAIERSLEDLREEVAAEDNARLKDIKARRLGILEQRLERFDKAEENREIISHQLAAIEDLLRLIHEQSLTLRDPQDVSRQLDTLAVEAEETADTVREMESFLQLQAEVQEVMAPPAERVR